MDFEEAVVSLDTLFDRNPGYANLYADTIDICGVRIPEEDAIAQIESAKTNAGQIQDAGSILATLIRRGGIARVNMVNGEEYAGSLEDLQNDETIPDDASIAYFVEATEAGRISVATYRDLASPKTLFAAKPEYIPGFKVVLEKSLQGATTAQLQEALVGIGMIASGYQDAQQLHASYFTGKLESHNALVWDRTCWRTTPAGEAMLNALQNENQ